jgi:putative SOS response-associated peptidase YedK
MSTVNAKGETLLDSNIWKDSFLKRRCLIPVDSFIEWRTEGKTKVPWMFAMHDDEPFALGGVWRHWRSPDGKAQMDTFAIITMEPNELFVEKTGHDRMPVIIKRQNYQRWLEPGSNELPPVDCCVRSIRRR